MVIQEYMDGVYEFLVLPSIKVSRHLHRSALKTSVMVYVWYKRISDKCFIEHWKYLTITSGVRLDKTGTIFVEIVHSKKYFVNFNKNLIKSVVYIHPQENLVKLTNSEVVSS